MNRTPTVEKTTPATTHFGFFFRRFFPARFADGLRLLGEPNVPSQHGTLRRNLGTGRQRQKFARLLPIRYRFEVLVEGLPANSHSDDYVYPMTHGTFDVEHIGSILDV
jgi:hypothetical protein